MLSSSDLHERLAATRASLRKLEDAALAERRREQELETAYAKTDTVRPDLLPRQLRQQRGD